MKEKVYLIRNHEGIYKIGFTKRNINKRLNELNISNPFDLEVIHTYTTHIGRKLEAYLHRYYKTKKLKGEWFALNHTDTNKFLDICEKFETNMALLKKYNNPFV